MKDGRYQILLTNDDGIASPGLWAAAEALSSLGYVTVIAPRDQSSGTGRSLPISTDGYIRPGPLTIHNQEWTVYSVGGTPAQAVQHAIMEIMETPPDVVVSGINYGENLGEGITVSGTVGAAMEAAALGIPALAASLELVTNDYYSYSTTVDFSSAAYFTCLFTRYLLENHLPAGVDLLKLDVPHNATPTTPWHMTSLAKHQYYIAYVDHKRDWNEPYKIPARIQVTEDEVTPDSDIRVLHFDHQVSLTPITLNMTARVSLTDMEKQVQADLKE